MENGPIQVFVKNDQGTTWGPLSLSSVELLIENGLLTGKLMVSTDGVKFAMPGRFPELRDAFPRELWGDVVAPGKTIPISPQLTPMPAEMILGGDDPPQPAASATPPPVAGIAPIAGPGARAAATAPRAKPAVRPSAVKPYLTPPPVAPLGVPSVAPVGAAEVSRAQRPPTTTPMPAAVSAPAAAPRSGPRPNTLPPSGYLHEVSPLRLYYLAAAGDENVLVSFVLSDRTLGVHFRRGSPELVTSTHAEDSVEAFLVREGLVRPDQLAAAEANRERFGGELLGALFGLAIMHPGTAFEKLAERAQGLLFKAMMADNGRFTVQHAELPGAKAMPLGNKWSVLGDVVRRAPFPQVKQLLADVIDLPVMRAGGRVPVEDLRLTPRETRALAYFDGVRSLNILWHELPQEAETVGRLALLLRELDCISFAGVKLAAPPPRADSPPAPTPASPILTTSPPPIAPVVPPSVAPVAPVVPSVAPAASRTPAPRPAPAARPAPKPAAAAVSRPAPTPMPVDPAKELAELRAMVAKIKSQNHFELLGISDKADASAVKIAYFKLARVYHPDTVLPGSPEELAALKGEVFAAIGEAYRTLSDEGSRARYLDELKHGAGEVDVAALLQAEELFQKACILVKARKYPDAVAMLDDCVKANPDEGEFYAWRGYAKFLGSADKKAGQVEANRDFQIALKKNERCAPLHYFMGNIAKILGDNATALKGFRRAAEIDPNHVDAQRELRMMGNKK